SRRRVLAQNEWPERSNVALAEQHYAGSADSWPIRAILMNNAGKGEFPSPGPWGTSPHEL
ncbi:MAG: hypothetical protein ACT4PV_13225, partial [Planctomycetaceae bacterium]